MDGLKIDVALISFGATAAITLVLYAFAVTVAAILNGMGKEAAEIERDALMAKVKQLEAEQDQRCMCRDGETSLDFRDVG